MSQLMRMTYGHGGTQLERILVSAAHQEPARPPRWLRLLLLAVWVVVPILVSLYAVPTSRNNPRKTIIDTSRLTIKPPPVQIKTFQNIPEPEPLIEKPATAVPKPGVTQETAAHKTLERQFAPPSPAEIQRPSINRSSTVNIPDAAEYQPRISRERTKAVPEIETAARERIRRETATPETPSERTSITRARGATAMDSSIAGDRVAVMRRATPAGDQPPVSGNVIPQRSIQRNQYPAGTIEDNGQRAVTVREKSRLAVEGSSTDNSSSAGVVRGVTLMSLEICSSPRKQEEAIKAVLSTVGSRRSCSDNKGEFQFKGTQRISSFNLMIFPSKGRRPSNRCEELDNAYKCLKNH